MTRLADAESQSRQWPQTAGYLSRSEQPRASGDPTLPNPRSYPETEHSRPSSGSSSFNNSGPGSQFNAPGGNQNNNTGNGNQFPGATFHAPVYIDRSPSGETQKDRARKEKEIEILKCLNKSPYRDRKDRNPDRVPGTCDWFVSHKLFQDWLESKSSRMLWVSADPGCGKSVLAKYLVDSVLPTTESRTVCYFFFKDDFEDQRNVVSALCCILHQLFKQKRVLLSDAILDEFDIEGETFTSSFGELWHTLINAAKDENAGEIVCLFDAIDECEAQGRSQLNLALRKLYETRRSFNLKFLLTSRPYGEIYRDFQPIMVPGLPVIHLSGESDEEVEKISKEIDIFIKARVQGIGAQIPLTQNEQDLLLRELTCVSNRTYLWVHLTLDLIKDDIEINKTKIAKATSNLPKSVDEAYDKILSKSRDSEKAKKILHIVVATARPLTLREMILALVLRENHRSYDDLDLEPEGRFRKNVRDTCGLFVTIIDGRIYLFHQTAREFLVQKDTVTSPEGIQRDLEWKHSLLPRESHRILTEICIWHLLLAEFETHPLDGNGSLSQYVEDHAFLDYSAKHWADHFRELEVKVQDAMTQSILRICDTSSKRFQTWFRIYWTSTNTDFPARFTTLMVASYFGLETAVKCLLKMDSIDLNSRDDTYRRSALSWAAKNGFDVVVELLIKGTSIGLKGFKLPFGKGAEVDSVDRYGRTPLSYAVWSGNVAVVELLIKAGAKVDSKDEIGGTPSSYAICSGHKNVIELLLKKGTQVGSVDDISKKLLFSAAEKDHEEVVRLLLETGRVDPDAKGIDGQTPLSWATEGGHEAVVELLLKAGANVDYEYTVYEGILCREPELEDIERRVYELEDRIMRRLENRREEDRIMRLENRIGRRGIIRGGPERTCTPLSRASEKGYDAVVKLLLETGNVNVDWKDKYGWASLSWATEGGHEAVAELLLKAGANVDYEYTVGPHVRTPLSRAREKGYEAVVKLLLGDGRVNADC